MEELFKNSSNPIRTIYPAGPYYDAAFSSKKGKYTLTKLFTERVRKFEGKK